MKYVSFTWLDVMVALCCLSAIISDAGLTTVAFKNVYFSVYYWNGTCVVVV